MGDLILIPKPEWKASEQVVKLLEDALAAAKRGEIQGIAYVAERPDDSYESGSTPVSNHLAVAGTLFSLGMRLLGFRDAHDDTSG